MAVRATARTAIDLLLPHGRYRGTISAEYQLRREEKVQQLQQ